MCATSCRDCGCVLVCAHRHTRCAYGVSASSTAEHRHGGDIHYAEIHLKVACNASAADVLGYSRDRSSCECNTLCGLRNYGNTCYLNALNFCLSKLDSLYNWVVDHRERMSSAVHRRSCLLCVLADDLRQLRQATHYRVVEPNISRLRARWNASFNYNDHMILRRH